MTGYAYMKFLESSPERYDRGIRWLSGGRIDEYYERVAEEARAGEGWRILDIGCGTGGVSRTCARRGARVTGIDVNPGMLEIARSKSSEDLAGSVEWVELGVAEIEDRFPPKTFDAVVSCLAFSELTSEEVSYALRIARSRLVPGGRIVIADEVEPSTLGGRLWYRARRIPLVAVTWLLTQATTRPVANLATRLREAGFEDVKDLRPWGSSFAIVIGEVGEEES